jgi:Flp pilus assembly pilin Flp
MSIQTIRTGFAGLAKRFHRNEKGNQTIETVLILALVAVLLTLGFKFMWGQESKGIIPTMISGIVDVFTEKVKTWIGSSAS